MSSGFFERCKEQNGVPQWGDDGVALVCANLRTAYEEPVTILQREQISEIEDGPTEKDRLVRYFHRVYPESTLQMWKNLSLDKLIELYQNLEIWYQFPGTDNPETPTEKRAATMQPFYRVPDLVNIQQFKNKKPYSDNAWIEVYHAGALNTDFYIQPDFFAGTYYYPAIGSGVFLPLGKTLVAYNKVHALKKMKVPNAMIYENSGPSFKRWVTRDMKKLMKVSGLDSETAKQRAIDEIIERMVKGKNKTRVRSKNKPDTLCYYGLGDEGDRLMAFSAIQRGYDTIQLVEEAQKGCDERGVLVGFEIIDLRTPGESAKLLMRRIPENYRLLSQQAT